MKLSPRGLPVNLHAICRQRRASWFIRMINFPTILQIFFPGSARRAKATSGGASTSRKYRPDPTKPPIKLGSGETVIGNRDFHRVICRTRRVGYVTCRRHYEKLLRIRAVLQKKGTFSLFLSFSFSLRLSLDIRHNESQRHYVNPRTIRERCRLSSLTSVGFLSQECAIDRATVARPLSSPYSELGHFDVRSMRLTYWPICPGGAVSEG